MFVFGLIPAASCMRFHAWRSLRKLIQATDSGTSPLVYCASLSAQLGGAVGAPAVKMNAQNHHQKHMTRMPPAASSRLFRSSATQNARKISVQGSQRCQVPSRDSTFASAMDAPRYRY